MARIRTIKPEFPLVESIGRVSRDARLLFIMLWTIVDDSGRTRAASRLLASLLYPFDDDAPGLIDGWLDELETEGCIARYVVDGTTYLVVTKWLVHQKIDRPSPSKLPEPPADLLTLASPREPSRDGSEPSLLDLGPRTMDLGAKEHGRADARQGTATSQPDTDWRTFDAAVSQTLGGARVVNAKTGQPLDWQGQLRSIAGQHSPNGVAGACAVWAGYVESDEWKFRPRHPRELPHAFGAWLADRARPKVVDYS